MVPSSCIPRVQDSRVEGASTRIGVPSFKRKGIIHFGSKTSEIQGNQHFNGAFFAHLIYELGDAIPFPVQIMLRKFYAVRVRGLSYTLSNGAAMIDE